MQIESLKAKGGFGSAFIGEALMRLLPDNFDWLGWPFLFLGIFLVSSSMYEWIFNKLKLKLNIRNKVFWPIQILVYLPKAVERCGTDLRNTPIVYNRPLHRDSFREQSLAFCISEGCDLYGYKKDSKEIDFIPKNERNNHFQFSDDCGQLFFEGFNEEPKTVNFYNVHVPLGQFKKFIKDIKNEHEQGRTAR